MKMYRDEKTQVHQRMILFVEIFADLEKERLSSEEITVKYTSTKRN